MGILSLLSGRAWAWLGAISFVAVLGGWAFLAIDSRGYARCEGEHVISSAHAAEEAQQYLVAEVERGERLSAELSKTQRRLSDEKAAHLAYAYGISGNCPGSLGMLTSAASSGSSLPEATGPSADDSAPVDPVQASEIAANIAENYGRCHINAAQLSALIEWHRQQEALETVR